MDEKTYNKKSEAALLEWVSRTSSEVDYFLLIANSVIQ